MHYWLAPYGFAKCTILLTVFQFRVVPTTPSSFSTNALGEPDRPFCLRPETTKAAPSLISNNSRFSLIDIKGSFGVGFVWWEKKTTPSITSSPVLILLNGLRFTN